MLSIAAGDAWPAAAHRGGERMKRELAALQDREYDLIVVGAGAFGSCAAWDAAQRGLTVALIDRGDVGGGTSANCFTIVHGGVRYLQHGDLVRVRRSARARRTLIRIAPHLVQPLEVAVPTYGHGMKGKAVLRLGFGTYDALTLDRNAGIVDPKLHIGGSRFLSRDAVIELYPGLRREGLTGGAVFHDGQLYNPARLVLAFARSAAEHGAVVANYAAAQRFLLRDRRVFGVIARDVLGGSELVIRSKTVLNAAGPGVGALLGVQTRPFAPRLSWSRDASFLVPRPLFEGTAALALQVSSKDSDTLVSRGGRHLLIVPWRGATLVGVWHRVQPQNLDHFDLTDGELESFLAEINTAYPSLALRADDVALCHTGLVLFGDNPPGGTGLHFAHRSCLVDHARLDGIEGLVTLVGVRYTMAPVDGVEAVDLVARKRGLGIGKSRLHLTPVAGGRVDDFDAVVKEAVSGRTSGMGLEVIRNLVHNHGTEYRRVLELCEKDVQLADYVKGSTVLKAEVIYSMREEMAQTLADVIIRRTDLARLGDPGRESLYDCAELMAGEHGWNRARTARELQSVHQWLLRVTPGVRSSAGLSAGAGKETGPWAG